MRFTVPQFIEHEAKIVGPLTFKQFVYIGFAGAICFILYFSLGKTNFFLFLLLAMVLMSTAIGLAFLKIGGRSLPTILGSFLKFSFSSKMYLWKKKEAPIIIFKKVKKPKKEEKKEEEELPLKIAEKSLLKKLSTKIETQTK